MDKAVNESSNKRLNNPKKKIRLDSKQNLLPSELEKVLEDLKEKYNEVDNEIKLIESRGITTDLRPQMQALHDYNDVKDLTQTVLGYIADLKNCTLSELHKKYNLPLE